MCPAGALPGPWGTPAQVAAGPGWLPAAAEAEGASLGESGLGRRGGGPSSSSVCRHPGADIDLDATHCQTIFLGPRGQEAGRRP